MNRLLASLSLAALVFLGPAATGQDAAGQVDPFVERFRLFNACEPMGILIEPLNDNATAIGLTKEALQAAAESRLRAARLYTEDIANPDTAYLYVNVLVVGRAVGLNVYYNKRVTDAFGVAGTAVTWFDGATGRHGGNGDNIVSGLSRYLDKFLAAYLRVNEPACGSSPTKP